MIQTEVISIDLQVPGERDRYDRLLSECPNAFIQQSTAWTDVIAGLGPDRPLFLVCCQDGRDVGGLPLYLFEHPLGNILTSVPQPGPLGGVFVRDDLPAGQRDAVYAALLARAEIIARDHGCLSLTIITNPFTPDTECYEYHLHPTVVFENFTQYIPVDKVVAGGQSSLRDSHQRNNLKRNLRKAKIGGLSVSDCASDAEFDAWYRIHQQRHSELGASPLSRRLLKNIMDRLVPHGHGRLVLVKKESEIAAGGLFIVHRAIMDAFILSMDSAYAEWSPNYLVVEEMLLWAASRGIRIFNWQSSARRQDGVYNFKKQWGSVEKSYAFVTKLYVSHAQLLAMGRDTIRTAYAGHYLIPFAALDDGFRQTRYAKP